MTEKARRETVLHHVSVGARDLARATKFYDAALAAGGTDDGQPGPQPQYSDQYYAAFLHDPDGNKIEAMRYRD